MPVYWWKVTFEMPPVRTVFINLYDGESEEHVRAAFARDKPRAVILTVTKEPSADGGEARE